MPWSALTVSHSTDFPYKFDLYELIINSNVSPVLYPERALSVGTEYTAVISSFVCPTTKIVGSNPANWGDPRGRLFFVVIVFQSAPFPMRAWGFVWPAQGNLLYNCRSAEWRRGLLGFRQLSPRSEHIPSLLAQVTRWNLAQEPIERGSLKDPPLRNGCRAIWDWYITSSNRCKKYFKKNLVCCVGSCKMKWVAK